MPEFDVIVSGGGPTGLTAALESAARGARVLVVEKRPPLAERSGHSRYQAVVLDAQTLVNLANLGVYPMCQPIERARFLDRHGNVAGTVVYPKMDRVRPGRSSDDLARIVYRRDVVAMTSIDAIELALLERCRQTANIEIAHDTQIHHVSVTGTAVTMTSAVGQSFGAGMLAIADGANSDRRGMMNLLGLPKCELTLPVSLVICRFASTPGARGIVIRNTPEDVHRYTAAFCLPGSTMLYVKKPDWLSPEDEAGLRRFAQAAACKSRLCADLLESPFTVAQQVRMSNPAYRDPRVFVLGDAFFSGTAILGLYLNKGIADAHGFGRVVGGASPASLHARQTDPAYSQLLMEEQAVSAAYSLPTEHLPLDPMSSSVVGLVPRMVVRLKLNRRGLVRTGATNLIDAWSTAASTASEIYTGFGFRRTGRVAAFAGKAGRLAQRVVE